MSAQIDDLRRRAVAHPQHEQRRQGDHGHGLRRDDERREQLRRGGASGSRRRRRRAPAPPRATKPGGGLRDGDQRVAHEEHRAPPRARPAPPTAAGTRRARRAAARTTSSVPSVSDDEQQPSARGGTADARRARGARRAPDGAGSPPAGAAAPVAAAPHACLRLSTTTKPGPTLRLARAPRFRGHSMRRRRPVHHAGRVGSTLWRQVFWLPDRPPAAPSRQRAGSGFSQPSSPVTAAGPRRSCTGFPLVALAGTSKRRGC